MKALIFDSGPLINLSMNGLLYLLEKLKKDFNGKFLITKEVKYETIDHPINIKKFELGALRIKNLLEQNIIELPDYLKLNQKKMDTETDEIMDMANHFFKIESNWMNLVSRAEISCLALSSELERLGFETIIAIDERTTRLLSEKPENLQKILSEKLHQRIEVIAENFEIFKKYKFIRSSEIIFVSTYNPVLAI